MITKIAHRNIKFYNFPCFLMSQSGQVIRDSDRLSQSQIDSILGNDIIAKTDNQKLQTKAIQNMIKDSAQNLSDIETVKELFYNLVPVKNQNFPVCIDPEEIVIEETPNQNIFALLNLTKECSYSDYQKALRQFRTQSQLYGDQTEATQIKIQDLQFKQLLKYDSKYIQKARQRFLVNISIPGTIQTQDPRHFMELRPIQQFRNTPLIPISDSAMRKHQQMLEDYHRRQFVFQVKRQSVVNFFLISVSVGVCAYLIHLVIQKEQERSVAFSRLKYKRTMGQQSNANFKIGS